MLPHEPTSPRVMPSPATLDYAGAAYARPGLIAPIGILSIIFGSLSALVAVLALIFALLTLFDSNPFSPTRLPPGGTIGPPQMQYQGALPPQVFSVPSDVSGATLRTVDADEAGTILAGLRQRGTVPDVCETALIELLQAQPNPIAPPVGSTWTAEHVASLATYTASPSYMGDGSTFIHRFDFVDGYFVFTPGRGRGLSEIQMFVDSAPLHESTSVDISFDGRTLSTTVNTENKVLPMMKAMQPSTAAMTFQVVSQLVTLGLAVMLIVAGAWLLKNRPDGRRLHLWWAAIKLVTVTIGTVVGTMIAIQMSRRMMAAMPSGPAFVDSAVLGGQILGGVLTWLITAAWPILVLILLTRRRIREYFGVGGAPDDRPDLDLSRGQADTGGGMF